MVITPGKREGILPLQKQTQKSREKGSNTKRGREGGREERERGREERERGREGGREGGREEREGGRGR